MQRLSVKEFEVVMREGTWVRGTLFSLRMAKNNSATLRFGVAVSKQLAKKPVQRNYYKRVLRHLVRTVLIKVRATDRKQGYDVVLFAQPQIQHKKFEVLKNDVQKLFQKANLLVD